MVVEYADVDLVIRRTERSKRPLVKLHQPKHLSRRRVACQIPARAIPMIVEMPALQNVRSAIRVIEGRALTSLVTTTTCAITGIRIVNGGGKAEAQAAHIWQVADGGPDEIQNGLALSATAHWLFDRHLISLDDDLGLLVSHNKVPSELLPLFPPAGKPIRLPSDRRLHPRLEYVQRHRERFAGLPS